MMSRAMLGAVGLCIVGLAQSVSADDVAQDARPTVLDIAPGSIDVCALGFNRGEEGWNNVLSLLKATTHFAWGWTGWDYKSVMDSLFGEGLLDLETPLAVYDLPESFGTTVFVADREFAKQSLNAPAGIVNGQIWRSDRLEFSRQQWMVLRGNRLSIALHREDMRATLLSPTLAEVLPEVESRILGGSDFVCVVPRGTWINNYWNDILPPATANDGTAESTSRKGKDEPKLSDEAGPPPSEQTPLTVLDITPATATSVAGLNRGKENWDNLVQLFGAIIGIPLDDELLRTSLSFQTVCRMNLGADVIRSDGPLAMYDLPTPMGATTSMGVTLYYANRDEAAGTLNAPANISDGEAWDIPARTRHPDYRFNVFQGDQLWMFNRSEGYESVRDAPPIIERVPAEEANSLSTADAILLEGDDEVLAWRWNYLLQPQPAAAEPLTEEQQAYAEIRQLVTGVEWMTAGLRVEFAEDDVEHETPTAASFHTGILFDHAADSEGAMLLGGLATPDRAATLAGLPQGDPLLAFAGSFADGDKLTYYRQLAQIGQRYWNRRNRLSESLPTRQFYGIVEEVGEHMQGVRVAAYRNPDPAVDGVYSIVFIADADEPNAFVAELQQMMRLAEADEVDLANSAGAVTDAEIEALVASLGDRVYRVRRDATNRLLVIGIRATPFLEARLEDESLELRTRAKVILDHFATLQSDEAKHFFGSDLLRQLDPDFSYVIAGETLADGTPIDWITVTVPEESQPYVQQFEAWLGPDWNRWRVAQTEDEIVICVGSRPELLSETLANLTDPSAPLLDVGDWNPEGTAYQFQLHFDAYEFVPERSGGQFFLPAPLEEGEATGLTSFGLTLAADALTCDAHFPLAQLKRLGMWFY